MPFKCHLLELTAKPCRLLALTATNKAASGKHPALHSLTEKPIVFIPSKCHLLPLNAIYCHLLAFNAIYCHLLAFAAI